MGITKFYNPRYRCRQGGEILRKRRESCITKVCLDYLGIFENAGRIAYVQRMNSGKIVTNHRTVVKLGRAGTADIYVRLNNGHTVWIENKTESTGLMDIQKQFRVRMEVIGDTYIIIRSLDELRVAMEDILMKNVQL